MADEGGAGAHSVGHCSLLYRLAMERRQRQCLTGSISSPPSLTHFLTIRSGAAAGLALDGTAGTESEPAAGVHYDATRAGMLGNTPTRLEGV
jgi:hypothetical protein